MMRSRLQVERGKLLEVLGHLGSIETPYIYLRIKLLKKHV